MCLVDCFTRFFCHNSYASFLFLPNFSFSTKTMMHADIFISTIPNQKLFSCHISRSEFFYYGKTFQSFGMESSSGHFRRVNSIGHFCWILMDKNVHENSSFWVNSSGQFFIVITNGANAGGAETKPQLGSANTVQCTDRNNFEGSY